ncbi:RICIN domain-containing protein [Kineosporia sp. NBRC 101731]|uniref:RICIN domain-containing protein n=1 Tax=Kineosporia sp. NBRC 101731 TaxID=3032199 RepID=UPI0024A35F86|nr:RICIN domain-containing protein [Kineosporia sp. NBRC 101731]GLY29549.1 hypothetical protein Kisp02_29140 [Kineosporia sp. NBRC 101731]
MRIPRLPSRERRPGATLTSAGLVLVVAGSALGALAYTWSGDPDVPLADVAPVTMPPVFSSAAQGPTSAPATPTATTTPPSPTASVTTRVRTVTVTVDPPAPTATPKKKTTTTPAFTSPFLIRNQSSGRCADLPNDGPAQAAAVLNQWTCTAGDSENQEFERIKVAQGIMLSNVKSQLCIDLVGYDSVPAGSNALLGQCVRDATDNAVFRSRAQGKGFQLVNVKSNLCLDLVADDPEGETGNGRNLVMATCSSAATQVWTFA